MNLLLRHAAAFLLSMASLEGQIPDPRDHHYEFAHKVLVEAMSEDGFVETLEEKKSAYLKQLWRDAGKRAKDGKKLSNKGLDYRIFESGEDRVVVIVILPEAEVVAEAHMVGAEFKAGERVGIVYTLENGFKRLTLAGWSEGRHLNFGEGPENDPGKFRDTILLKNQ